MDFNNILFRCSSIKHIMTEPKTKKDREAGILSKTVRNHLADKYVSARYGRETEIFNKYVTKGLQVEEDSLTLYSRYKGVFYTKNEKLFTNDFISGTPDIVTSDSEGGVIIDIKSSWDVFTFFRAADPDDLNDMYYWQMQGYMALTGAKKAIVAYCLVNTPDALIADEQRRIFYRMNVATTESPAYVEACEALERSMRFDDIDMKERVIEIMVERSDEDIQRIYEKAAMCREYMNTKYGTSTVEITGDTIQGQNILIAEKIN